MKYKFYKKHPKDKIWWVDDGTIGSLAVSFDKKKVLYLYRDFPKKFTDAETFLFCKENPYWADYFADRLLVVNDEQKKIYIKELKERGMWD